MNLSQQNNRSISVLTVLFLAVSAAITHARLGETEAQAQARYGEPTPQLAAPSDKPLLESAKEVIYSYQGWRIRAAYVANTTHRIEYVKIPEGGNLKPITDTEAQAILEAEKGQTSYRWREQKPRTGFQGLNDLTRAVEGRLWERSDHAEARLKLNLVLVLQSKEAESIEKKALKATGKSGSATVPKF